MSQLGGTLRKATNLSKKRRHGFRSRKATKNGMKILKNKRAKGRKRIAL